MKAIVKFLVACVAFVMTLGTATADAAPHTLLRSLASGMMSVGQAQNATQGAARQEYSKLLTQARQAMDEGKFSLAEEFVQRAERLNIKPDALFEKYADSPARVKAELAQRRAALNAATPPSARFTPPGADPRMSPATSPQSGPSNYSPGGGIDNLTNDAKAKAKAYLDNGRRCLDQRDLPGAIGWYHKALATGAAFAPTEFSPATLATQLRQAGVAPNQLVPPAFGPAYPEPLRPGDLAANPLDRLPPTRPASGGGAFPLVESPYGSAGSPAGASAANGKAEAVRLAAQARAALDRGDHAQALRLAEQAQSMRVPETAFGPGDLRPWEVLLQVQSAFNRQAMGAVTANHTQPVPPPGAAAGSFPISQGLYVTEQDRTRTMPAQAVDSRTAPDGQRLYQEGLRALENQDRDTALNLFRQAWQNEQQLDPATRQQLKDKLSLLSSNDRLAPGNGGPAGPLEEVGAQQDVLRQKLFREINNEQQVAQQMMATDPRGGVARMRELRNRVAEAQIDPETQKQFLTLVDRATQEMEAYVQQNAAEIDLNERNSAITAEIERNQKEKVEVQDQIAQLVEKYNTLVEEERFAEAEVIAGQVRELDPLSPIARTLSLRSKIAERYQEQESIREQSEQGFYDAMTRVQESGIPYNDGQPINFGDVNRWNQLTSDRLKWLESQNRQLSPGELTIQKALKEQVEVRFSDRPLKEVLETLGSVVGINVYPDPQGLAAEGVTTDTPVSINLSQPISLKSALNLILDPLRLSYVVQNEVLLITSEQTRKSQIYPKVYNVADLVIPIPNFIPGYNVGLPAAIREAHQALGYGGVIQPASMSSMPLTVSATEGQNGGTVNPSVLAQSGAYGMLPKHGARPSQQPGYGPGSLGGAAMADFDTLIELITSTIAPDTWDAVGGPGAVESFPTNLSLVISQTQDVHDQIADLLAQLRRLQDLQVTIEVRFITLRDDFFERIGVDFDFNIDDNVTELPRDDAGPSTVIGLDPLGQPTADFDLQFTQSTFGNGVPAFGNATDVASFGFAILSDIEVFFLLNAAEGDRRSNVLQAPKVTLFNGQLASVNDTSQRPFVTSLIPVVGDFAAAHQPVIVVLSEGTSLSVQAVVSSDRRFVRLTLVPFFSQIGDVEEFTFVGKTSTQDSSNVVDAETGKVNSKSKETVTEGTTVQLPTFSFTTVSTTVSVPDGGTVLLGGIKRLREGRNESGVPMLSKVPYVNRLFKNVGIGRETQSLMLMVTPRIIIQEEEESKLGIEMP